MSIPVALYPYCLELYPIVKFFNAFQNNYTLTKLISPSGLGLSGKDASFAANHPSIGLTVYDTLDENSCSWSILFVVETEKTTSSLEKQKFDFILRTLKSGKKVIYFVNQISRLNKSIKEILLKYPNTFVINEAAADTIFYEKPWVSEKIQIPVILIGGLIEESDTKYVTLSLANYLRTSDMKVTVYSNSSIGKIFNFKSIYPILKCTTLSEVQKIDTMHQMLKYYEIKEKPDVIIIEAPDPVMKYNELISNGYGIWTYMLSQSVDFDYFICCLPFEMINDTFLSLINDDLTKQIRCPINAVHASNIIVDAIDTTESKQVSIVHTSLNNVKKHLDNTSTKNIPVFNIVSEDISALYNALHKE